MCTEPPAVSILKVLENKETAMLQWAEPWPAIKADGSETHADVIMQCAAAGCINMQRLANPDLELNEECLLLDFIAIHWVKILNPEKYVNV
jgi:hypothetical protein